MVCVSVLWTNHGVSVLWTRDVGRPRKLTGNLVRPKRDSNPLVFDLGMASEQKGREGRVRPHGMHRSRSRTWCGQQSRRRATRGTRRYHGNAAGTVALLPTSTGYTAIVAIVGTIPCERHRWHVRAAAAQLALHQRTTTSLSPHVGSVCTTTKQSDSQKLPLPTKAPRRPRHRPQQQPSLGDAEVDLPFHRCDLMETQLGSRCRIQCHAVQQRIPGMQKQ